MIIICILFSLFLSVNGQESHGTLAVRPFTVHFFYDLFAKNLTAPEKESYFQVLRNHLVSKDQALKKIDSIAHEKGNGFEKSYLTWKNDQEKHNIDWWRVNDIRMLRTSGEAQNLYESIKAVHFNKTLSFYEDCTEYDKLIEQTKKDVRNELEWSTLNCSLLMPELNPHGRLDFKLIL